MCRIYYIFKIKFRYFIDIKEEKNIKGTNSCAKSANSEIYI